MRAYLHACLHAWMLSCIHAFMLACLHASSCMHTWIHACTHAFLYATAALLYWHLTCMHTCMHVYMHECFHTYMHSACLPSCICMPVYMHACMHSYKPGLMQALLPQGGHGGHAGQPKNVWTYKSDFSLDNSNSIIVIRQGKLISLLVYLFCRYLERYSDIVIVMHRTLFNFGTS